MNREDAVIYLMRNPSAKLNMTRDIDGKIVDRIKIVHIDSFGDIMMGECNFSVYIENDKSEFEIARQLKQMSFVDAIRLIIDTDLYMKSDEGYTYYGHSQIDDINVDEVSGLWRVEDYYE